MVINDFEFDKRLNCVYKCEIMKKGEESSFLTTTNRKDQKRSEKDSEIFGETMMFRL